MPSPLSALKGSPPWHEARGQGYVTVWLCMAATLGAIPGLSIDAAQRVRYACVVHCDGKRYLEPGKKGWCPSTPL
jgi:hypothetical protein